MAVQLDGFVFNGTEYNIQDTVAREQIAAQLASRTEVNADYAAEVIDARVGNNGKLYPTLGEAMRQQIAALQAALDEATISKFNGKTFSVIGDDVTAFPGFLPSGNTSWYDGSNADVEEMADTFLGKLVFTDKMKMVVNNSWDGTKLGYDGKNADSFMAGDARIHKLGSTAPDYIFVMGGKNDIAAEFPLGEFTAEMVDTANLQEEDTATFAAAYKVLIQKLMEKFSTSKVVVMWYHNLTGYPIGVQSQYADVAEKVAKFYGCQWVDFRKCGITPINNADYDEESHPNKAGNELYYQYLIQELR